PRQTRFQKPRQRRRRGRSEVPRPGVNRVILVGRLAADPELSYMPSGSAVSQLRLATNEGEQPEFHQLRAWGKLAEFAGSYLKKGRLLYIEGRLHWSSWQASDGSPRRSCEVRVSSLQVLDQRPEPNEQMASSPP